MTEGFTPQDKGMMEQVQDPKQNDDMTTDEVYDNTKVDNPMAVPDDYDASTAHSEPVVVDPTVPPVEAPVTRTPEKVSIGRIVVYRSRTGNYSVPAIINCTTTSIYQPGVEAGFVPSISALDNVHLTVLTPGTPGMRSAAGFDSGDPFLVKSPYPVSENVSGCYQEWDIPYDPDGGPGTWKWPERV